MPYTRSRVQGTLIGFFYREYCLVASFGRWWYFRVSHRRSVDIVYAWSLCTRLLAVVPSNSTHTIPAGGGAAGSLAEPHCHSGCPARLVFSFAWVCCRHSWQPCSSVAAPQSSRSFGILCTVFDGLCRGDALVVVPNQAATVIRFVRCVACAWGVISTCVQHCVFAACTRTAALQGTVTVKATSMRRSCPPPPPTAVMQVVHLKLPSMSVRIAGQQIPCIAWCICDQWLVSHRLVRSSCMIT